MGNNRDNRGGEGAGRPIEREVDRATSRVEPPSTCCRLLVAVVVVMEDHNRRKAP